MFSLLLSVCCATAAAPQQPPDLARMRIDGVVVGADRLPVPACEVWLDDQRPRVPARTDGSGGFSLITERRQFLAVHARVPGQAVGAVWVDGLQPGQPFVRVVVWPARTLRGMVRTEAGEPVPGALVGGGPVDLAFGPLISTASSAADGAFAIDVVPGPLHLRACKEGLGGVFAEFDGGADDLVLAIDPDTARTLEVTVVDAPAPLLATARVRLRAEWEGFAVPLPTALAAASLATGTFAASGLPPRACIHLELELADAAFAPVRDFVPTSVRSWQTSLRVTEPSPLRGRLVDDRGQGQGGIALAAVAHDEPWSMQRPRVTISKGDGSFAFAAPVADGAKVSITSLDPAVRIPGGDPGPGLVVHDPATVHTVRVEQSTRLTGRILAPDGRPVVGAEVLVMRGEHQVVNTDLDGRFFCVDRPLDRAIVARLFVNEPVGSGEFEFAAQTDGEQDLGELRLVGGSAIRGVVRDGAGRPLPGARVWIDGEDQPRSRFTLTDRDGRYAFAGLAKGTFRVAATRRGLADLEESLRVEGKDVVRDLAVK